MKVNIHDTVDSYERRQAKNFNDIMGGVLFIFLGIMISFLAIEVGFVLIFFGFVWIFVMKKIHQRQKKRFSYH